MFFDIIVKWYSVGSSGEEWRISIIMCMTTTKKYTIPTTKI